MSETTKISNLSAHSSVSYTQQCYSAIAYEKY